MPGSASALRLSVSLLVAACGPAIVPSEDGGSTGASTGTTTVGPGVDAVDEESGPTVDLASTTGATPECIVDGCDRFDIVVVIDNSSTMAEEQLDVARSLPGLLDELVNLRDANGELLDLDVNLMVTTTDMGHPLCAPLQRPGYQPQQGAPVREGCNARIASFTGLDPMDPVVVEEACTEGCPVDVVPDDPFIHFDRNGSNVPNDDVAAALSCLGPQGIDGCSYEAPLEAMLRAIDPQACWNDPQQPACAADPQWADVTRGFLREDSTLVFVVLTDELDCSVAPGGETFFTDLQRSSYWNIDPQQGSPQASSAICFNAGVSCDDQDGDGFYESCSASSGHGVLHPVERYVSALDQLTEAGREVVMLGVMGVPEVLEHSPVAPFQPIEGGVVDLVYRAWIDAPYPRGDLPPAEWDEGRRAADAIFELGELGPGCTRLDDAGAVVAQGLPPVRMREVCESLDFYDEALEGTAVRCCIESLCDSDFSQVMSCISGVVPLDWGLPLPG